MRLGTGPRLLSQPQLPTYDARLPFGRRQLSTSLVALADLLLAADGLGIRFYRMAAPLVPVMTPLDLAAFRAQLEQCASLAQWLGQRAAGLGQRLTVHPVLEVQLGSADAELAQRGLALVVAWSELLAAMDLGPEACLVVHIGGGADRAARERFARRAERLSGQALARLAVENDELYGRLEDGLWLHQRLGLPVVWDYLHWRCLNPGGAGAEEAYRLVAATWPAGVPPKLHFSSASTSGGGRRPLPRRHADLIDPFAFLDFLALVGKENDIMLEARAKDLALLKLRDDLIGLGCQALLEDSGAPPNLARQPLSA